MKDCMGSIFMPRDLIELCKLAAQNSEQKSIPYYMGYSLRFYCEYRVFDNCGFTIKEEQYHKIVPLTFNNLIKLFGPAGQDAYPGNSNALCYQDQIVLYYTLTVDEINGLINNTKDLITLLEKLPDVKCTHNNVYVQELFLTQHFEKFLKHVTSTDQLTDVLRNMPIELRRNEKIMKLMRHVLANDKADQSFVNTLCSMPQELILPTLKLSKNWKPEAYKNPSSMTQFTLNSDWKDGLRQRFSVLQASHCFFNGARKKNQALIGRFLEYMRDINTSADKHNSDSTPYTRYIQLEAFLTSLAPGEYNDLVSGSYGKSTRVALKNFVGFERGSEAYVTHLKQILIIQPQQPTSKLYNAIN